MAVVHISEADAAKDFLAVMDRVKAGDEVRIDTSNGLLALAKMSQPVMLSEIMQRARERNSPLLPDDQFGNDVEAAIYEHSLEIAADPWESF